MNQVGRSWASRSPSPWRTVSTSHGEPSAQDTLIQPKTAHHIIMATTTARERLVISASPSAASSVYSAYSASMRIVTGPSASMSIFMSAPKRPVATSRPRPRRSSATASTRGSATSPGAALFQVGRRPLRVSA